MYEKRGSLQSKRLMVLGGEEELLACYLANGRNLVGTELSKAETIIISDGCWKDFTDKPEYVDKKKEDAISYFWDSIINRAHTAGGSYEHIAKELARPNRFERRGLSKAFIGAQLSAKAHPDSNVLNREIITNGITYCFLFYDGSAKDREFRKELLMSLCHISRGMIKTNSKVIGVATEMKIEPYSSYDFCYIDEREWTEEDEKEMKALQKETGFLTKPNTFTVRESEYPNLDRKEGARRNI